MCLRTWCVYDSRDVYINICAFEHVLAPSKLCSDRKMMMEIVDVLSSV